MLPYWALLTVDDVRMGMFGSGGEVARQLADEDSEVYEAATAVIQDVTDDVEAYLNRDLIVRPQTLQFASADAAGWRYRTAFRGPSESPMLRSAWARQWPVVQVTSVDGDEGLVDDVTLMTAKRGGQIIAYDPAGQITSEPFEINALCGFRRRDHADLATLKDDVAAEVIDDLTVLPPILPGRIRAVALRLCVAEIRQQAEAIVGLASATRRIDNMVVDSRSTAPQQYFPHTKTQREKELVTLTQYRWSPIGG